MTLHLSSTNIEPLHTCALQHLLQSAVITKLTAVYYTTARGSRNYVINRTEQSVWIFRICVLAEGDCFTNYSYGHHSVCMESEMKIICIKLGC